MILNIAAYHFVHVEDPQGLAEKLGSVAEARGLRGTLLVAGEGINLFLAGDEAQVREFVVILRTDMRFAAIAIKESLSRSQPFARLKVKVKPEIISFRRDGASPLDGRA
ncbi:MAG TPA: sulfurtransferase, partial [Luteimonas sp.]